MIYNNKPYRITKSLLGRLESDPNIDTIHGNMSFKTVDNLESLKNKIMLLGTSKCIIIDDNLVVQVEPHIETCGLDELKDLEHRSFFKITKLSEDKDTDTVTFTRTNNVRLISDSQFIIDDLSIDILVDNFGADANGLFGGLTMASLDLRGVNTSDLTSTELMFCNFYTFKINLEGLDFSNVTDTNGMFASMIDTFIPMEIDLDDLSIFYTNDEYLLSDWVDLYGREDLHTEIIGLGREITAEELAI